MDTITITKPLSKQGKQTILIIPSFLDLAPKDVVEATIKVVRKTQ